MSHARCIAIVTALGLAASTVAQTRLHAFHGDQGSDRFGISVDSIGDVDGDGHADLVVGAFWADAPLQNSGLVRVFSGATGNVLWTVGGDATWDELGWVVAGAGDVDGDGCPDVVAGAPLDDDVGGVDCGSARVMSGHDGHTIWLFPGGATRDLFGSAVAGAGDVNGDGYADVIVGRRFDDGATDDAGQAKVFSGRDGSLLHEVLGDHVGDFLGWSVAGVGDVDGDHHDDYAIGVPRDDTGGSNAGQVRVYSGRTNTLVHTLNGTLSGAQLGLSLAGAGDVDRDGHRDLLVGAPYASVTDYRAGRVLLFSGADGAVLRSFDGVARNDFFGWSVAGLGDVDGDGIVDLGTGTWAADPNGDASGQAWVLSGADGAVLATFAGDTAGDRLGWSIAGAGDVDSDGRADVIVGAYLDDVGQSGSGSAFVYAFGGVSNPPVIVERGTPCAGADGRLPRIEVDGDPSIGATFTVLLRSAPTLAPTVLNLGNAIAIPLDPLGAPTCSGYADPGGLNLPTATDGLGVAVLFLALPPDPALAGVRLDLQWIVRDAAANALGFVFSDAAGVRFGG